MMGHTQHRMQLYVPSSHQQQEAERPEDRCQARGPCRARAPTLRALLAAKGTARPRSIMMGPVGARYIYCEYSQVWSSLHHSKPPADLLCTKSSIERELAGGCCLR